MKNLYARIKAKEEQNLKEKLESIAKYGAFTPADIKLAKEYGLEVAPYEKE